MMLFFLSALLLFLTPTAFAATACTALTGASSLDGTECMAIDQGGNARQTGSDDILNFVSSSGDLQELKFQSAYNKTVACGATSEGSIWYDSAANAFKYCDGASATAFGGMANIVEDATPQLGGALDLNGNAGTDKQVLFNTSGIMGGDTGLTFNSSTNVLTVSGGVSGNSSTATALAANGANCSAGSAPLGVDASGAAESCTDYEEDLSNSAGLAAALSDETGSGSAVFGSSPSLTTPSIAGSTHTGSNTFAAGTGSGTYNPEGLLSYNSTAVGNVGTGEDNLMTYSVPANSLSTTGKGLHITAWGRAANNANAKTVKCYFGSAVAIPNGAMATSLAQVWFAEIYVFRTGSSAQDVIGVMERNTSLGGDAVTRTITTGSETDSGAITVKCTGEGTSDNDLVQEGMLVEFYN